jgi:hypothetical protein
MTHNNTDYEFDLKNETTALGNASYYFNPDCDYTVGQQYWIAGVTDECYEDENTSSNFTVTVIGDLINTIEIPQGEEFLRDSNITIRVNVTDECSPPQLIDPNRINISMTSQNTSQSFYCNPIFNQGLGLYNCSFNTSYPIIMPSRGYNITIFTNMTYYNPENTTIDYETDEDTFFIETEPILGIPVAIPTIGGWSENFDFEVNVTDEDYDSMTVCCYIKRVEDINGNPVSDDWSKCSASECQQDKGINVTFSFPKQPKFPSTQTGTWSLIFNVTDDPDDPSTGGNEYNYTSQVINFTVEKDDVEFIYLEGNETSVNRVSGSVTLKLNTTDIDDPTQIIRFIDAFYWVTTNASK